MDHRTRKPLLLQFDSLLALAQFAKGVSDRGYVLVVKDLTLQVQLTEAELETAAQQFGAKLLPFNKLAA